LFIYSNLLNFQFKMDFRNFGISNYSKRKLTELSICAEDTNIVYSGVTQQLLRAKIEMSKLKKVFYALKLLQTKYQELLEHKVFKVFAFIK